MPGCDEWSRPGTCHVSCSGRLNGYAPRLNLRQLGDGHFEYAIVALCRNTLGVHSLGQREAPHETAGCALNALPAGIFLMIGSMAFTRYAQNAVIHRYVNIGWIDAGNVGTQQETVRLFNDVHGRYPVPWVAVGDRVEVAVQLAYKRPGFEMCDFHDFLQKWVIEGVDRR